MRANRLIGFLILFGLLILIDWLLVFAIEGVFQEHFWIYMLFPGSSILFFVVLFANLVARTNWQDKRNYKRFFMLFGVSVALFVPKFALGVFVGFNALVQTIASLLGLHLGSFILYLGLALAAFLFLAIVDGILFGRFRFRVIHNDVISSKIPEAFHGFKIVQISDMHIGSFFDNHKAVEKGIARINALQADLVLFTGDLVNNFASETDGWLPVLSKIKAKHGVFAILGNHDYGDYVRFESIQAKQQNRQDLISFFQRLDWKLLLNQNARVYIKNEFIQLIGIENWGLPPFPQYGDLKMALSGTEADKFSILLSHDPSHWDAEVREYPQVDLTLSGHTHGMQFGFEFGKLKWSPVKWKYPKWAGAYFRKNQQLYVNRGFGYIGFPGRVGIRPEISLHHLKKG